MSWEQKHGTRTGYSQGCRCEKCSKSQQEYTHQYYLENKERLDKINYKYYLDNKEDRDKKSLKYRRENKEKVNKSRVKRREKLSKITNNIKQNIGCNVCGESNPICLDFHHIAPKNFCVGSAVGQDYSLDRILDEINNCDIICRNCHAITHWGQN